MLASSSRILSRQSSRRLTAPARRLLSSHTVAPASRHGATTTTGAVIAGAMALTIVASYHNNNNNNDNYSFLAARNGDAVGIGMPTQEPVTGIFFPALCNGMQLVGVGLRIKYVFVKVYAVGTYMDPIAMMAVKRGSPEDIEKALLDPTYPRTIRVVMNRGLSIDKYTAAIVESIEPRLKGRDLET
jgi:hypothetical protein